MVRAAWRKCRLMRRDGSKDKRATSRDEGVGIYVGNKAKQVAVKERYWRERGIKLKENKNIAKCMQTKMRKAGEREGGRRAKMQAVDRQGN